MGSAACPLHDAGNNRSIERGSDLQAARRGSLTIPAKPAGEREQHRSYTTPWDTIIPAANHRAEQRGEPRRAHTATARWTYHFARPAPQYWLEYPRAIDDRGTGLDRGPAR